MKRQKWPKSNVVNFQRISLKSCEKMLHSSYDLPTKYEQPISTSANTIAFSVRTPQAFDVHQMVPKVSYSSDRIEWSFASYHKPSEVQSKDGMHY